MRQSLKRAREEVQEGREAMAEIETENEQLQEAVEGPQEQVDEYEAEISQARQWAPRRVDIRSKASLNQNL